MMEQVTLESYIKENYPDILLEYKAYAAKDKKLSIQEICDLPLDVKGIPWSVVAEFKKLDISSVGKLIRVSLIYSGIGWVSGVGHNTINKLHSSLQQFGINVIEPDLTKEEIRKYAMENCTRNLEISLDHRIDYKTMETLNGMSIYTIKDIIDYLKEHESFDMVEHLAGYQRDNIMALLNQFAKYPECVQYEFI